MVEFRSKLEDIMVTEELRFNPSPSFGQYKLFLEQAIPHPAKMNTKLLKFLIKQFTKEGDTVLDPMCGSGSTGVVASLLNRNAVQVDIEKKFVDWAEQAKRKVEAQATLTPKGSIRNICGDSRKLSEILQKVDVIVTSPPYGEAQDGHGIAKEGYRGKKHSPTDLVGNRSYMPDKFESQQNISKLKYDAVITSPPYAHDSVVHKNRSGETQVAKEKFGYSDFYSESEDNIGNLKKETYLEAMLKVYMEMFRVLKPDGKAIIIIKPFIRNKKVVDLPYHTWLLLGRVGFKLVKLYKLRLKQDSFWRILYRKKYPRVPEIKHEYVIVTQK